MEIVEQIAPFLKADADPYPVIHDGKVLWVLDMYTSTNYYPYSQALDIEAQNRLTLASELDLGVTPPAIVLMVGLQGSGKTTTTAKIAKRLSEKER